MRTIRRLFRRNRAAEAMACERAIALLAQYLDEVLDPRQQARLEAHLAGCRHCSEYLEQLRTTISLARQVDPGTLDAETRTALTDLYRAWQEP
ncbi:MAG: hypothetical protein NVSMB48_12030 [Marmoricola sp.]